MNDFANVSYGFALHLGGVIEYITTSYLINRLLGCPKLPQGLKPKRLLALLCGTANAVPFQTIYEIASTCYLIRRFGSLVEEQTFMLETH